MPAVARAARPVWAEHVAASRRKVTTTLRAAPPMSVKNRGPKPGHSAGKHLRLRYPIIASIALGAIIITQLLLSIAISADAYHLQDLNTREITLQRQLDGTKGDLERMASPTHMVSDAVALGMVPSGTPAFVRLSDGSVLGGPETATSEHVDGNLVPNSLLDGIPLITAKIAAEQQAAADAATHHAGH